MIERYTRPEMGKIWTPENRYQAWLRVELAVCEAWNRVGEISDADMETLRPPPLCHLPKFRFLPIKYSPGAVPLTRPSYPLPA